MNLDRLDVERRDSGRCGVGLGGGEVAGGLAAAPTNLPMFQPDPPAHDERDEKQPEAKQDEP